MKWSNVKAVVTGGASGLGAAVVARILESNGLVAVVDLEHAINQLQTKIKSQSTIVSENLLMIHADVLSDSSVESALEYIETRFNDINLLVNCAGILISKKMLSKAHEMQMSEFERVIAVNLSGTFRVCQAVSKKMMCNEIVKDERGVIINTASIAAYEGQIGQLAYSASKGGVISMTLPMARELAKYKIRVMSIAPGIFDTSMLNELSTEKKLSIINDALHPQRLGKAQEFAQLVQQIVENSMLNGTTIRLDGGLRLPSKSG